MSNPYNNIIKAYKGLAGKLAGGDYSFTVSRPDYSAVDGTAYTYTKSGLQLFLEPTNPSIAQDKVVGAEYFSVAGYPDDFTYGDIITGTNDIPTLTIIQSPEEQEIIAVKTPWVGRITDVQMDIYTHVLYDFAEARSSGPDVNNTPSSLNDPVRHIFVYNRPNIKPNHVFIEEDGTVWEISLIDDRSKLQVLFLTKPGAI